MPRLVDLADVWFSRRLPGSSARKRDVIEIGIFSPELIRPQCVFNSGETRFVDGSDETIQKHLLSSGDILVVRSGPLRGRAGIFQQSDRPALPQPNQLIIVRPLDVTHAAVIYMNLARFDHGRESYKIKKREIESMNITLNETQRKQADQYLEAKSALAEIWSLVAGLDSAVDHLDREAIEHQIRQLKQELRKFPG